MTNALCNPTNYHFLMKVPRMKTNFKTFVRHVNKNHNATYSREDKNLRTNIYNFSQITQLYPIKDNARMFYDSQTIPSISPN